MLPLISVVLAILSEVGLKRLLPVVRKHRRQVRFIRETLASSRKSDGRRVIASLSTVPERIDKLGPTIRSLLRQTRPPDEIVLAVPEFSIREQRPYAVPKYISHWPRLRVLRCGRGWGRRRSLSPWFRILAAGRGTTLIMVVGDDRTYPRDALETYLHYNEQLPEAALCFRGAVMPRSLDWRDAKMIYASELRKPQPAAVITGCGSYLIRPRFFDESLWDYSRAPRGRYLDQRMPQSSRCEEICCTCIGHDAQPCFGNAGPYRYMMFPTGVNTTTTKRSHFSATLGTSLLRTKDVGV
jgi:hypothetical protein